METRRVFTANQIMHIDLVELKISKSQIATSYLNFATGLYS